MIWSANLRKHPNMKQKTKDNLTTIALFVGGAVVIYLFTLAFFIGCEAVVLNVGRQILR